MQTLTIRKLVLAWNTVAKACVVVIAPCAAQRPRDGRARDAEHDGFEVLPAVVEQSSEMIADNEKNQDERKVEVYNGALPPARWGWKRWRGEAGEAGEDAKHMVG